MRDTRLQDNASPAEFSTRINTFTVHINPYLEVSLADERLGKFVLSQLPESLQPEARALKRELEKDDELKFEQIVISNYVGRKPHFTFLPAEERTE